MPDKVWAYYLRVIVLEGERYIVWANLWAVVTIGIAKANDFKTFVMLPAPLVMGQPQIAPLAQLGVVVRHQIRPGPCSN